MADQRMIRVAVMDDHQGIIDGYRYRLEKESDIRMVSGVMFGEALDPLLSEQPVDVLLLDVYAPTSPENANPYPILFAIPRLLEQYPGLQVLVISVEDQSSLIRAVMNAGASGYILKDDHIALRELGSIIRSVANGGIYLSRQAHEAYTRKLPGAASLAPRQQEALSLCVAYPNLKTADLALKLGVAHSTFRNLLSDAYLRLNVRNLSGAIIEARRQGLITLPKPPGG